MLWYCETKSFPQKIVISPFDAENLKFSIPEFFSNTRVLYEIFRYFETENFRRKIVILPPLPLLSINFFATGSFLKHSTEGFLYEMFRYYETKQFRRKIVIPPPPPFLTFSHTRSFLKHKGSSANFLLSGTKIFRRKVVIPLFCIKYRNQWWN